MELLGLYNQKKIAIVKLVNSVSLDKGKRENNKEKKK